VPGPPPAPETPSADRPAAAPPGGTTAPASNAALPAPPGAPLGPIEGSATLAFTARGPRTDPALTLDLAAPRLRAPVGTTTITADALAIRAEVLNPLTAPRGTASGTGRVMGLPLELDIAAQPETADGVPGARITRGALAFGPARLALSGLVQPRGKPDDPADGPRVRGELKLEVPDLAPFSALAGQPIAGALTAEASGDSAAAWRLRIAAPRLGAAGQEGRGTLALEGQGARTRVALEAGNAAAELRLAATTTLVQPLVAEAQQLSVSSGGETLRIVAPLRIRVDGANYALENLQATTGQGGRISGNLAARGPEQALSGQLAFNGLPLSLARVAAPDLSLRGQFGGEARFGGTLAVPDVSLTLRGQGLGADTAQLRRLPPGTLTAEARLRGEAIEGRANLVAGPAIRLEATVRMPDAQSLNATLNGELDAGPLADIALAGGADRVSGRVSIALRAEGPVAEPRLSGAATLRNLNYSNSETGLRLDNVNGRLVANGDRLLFQGVTGRTPDGGTVALAGSVAPLDATIPVDLTLTARRATLVNPDLGQAVVNADLSLRGALRERARFAGTVTVTGGELRVPDRLPNSVPVLVPFREVGRTPPGRAPPRRPATARRGRGAPPPPPAAFNVDLAVRLDVPGRLYLRGRGLDTELVGRLDIAGSLAEPQVSGDLRTRRGTLDVLGKRLELTRGIVKWDAGGVIPSLDILATTRSSTHSITVGITGLANAPEIQLGSSPDLPQDEVVARLLFDRATSSLSPFEIIQIAQAVGQLAGVEPPGGGVDGALGRVRRFLGLDRLNAGGDARGGTAVQAGNYIAPGVYLGLQSGSTGTGLGVQAEIVPGLKLEGSAGTSASRLGMTYEYEW
jgi:translocation and assembly module TamB